MSWGRFWLLGDLGRFGSDDYHRHAAHMLRAGAKVGKEADQDEQLRQLREQNYELKLYVAGLLQLLVENGAIQTGDVENLVGLVERAQLESRQASTEPTSEDLQAIAAAAQAAMTTPKD